MADSEPSLYSAAGVKGDVMLLRQEEKADECQCLDASVGDFQVSHDYIVPVFRLAPAHAAPDPS